MLKAAQQPMHHQHKPRIGWPVIVVALVVVIALAYFFIAGSGIQTVRTSSNFSLFSSNSVNFMLPGNDSVYSIYLAAASPGSATFYVGKEPILINKISVFTLIPGSAVNVSTEGLGTANIEVKLHSSSNNSATVEIVHIPKDFNARVSGSVTYLANSSQGSSATTVTTTIAATTTIGQGTTTAPTTTVSTSGTSSQALVDANLTTYGTLMNNYKVLYNNGKQCTQNTYNIDMANAGKSYSPPNDYYNASQFTPTDVKSSAAKVSGSVYNVTYILNTPIGNSNVLTLKVDSASNTLISEKFGGFFSSETYSTLNQKYQAAVAIGDNCASYIP
ncbi:MAG: hypothetical protein KGH69_01805 [Candidatus Micrarchaeota archaeon]|nr:hypothetical protein [Candidatus Micrarchaeota archaeon]